MNPAIIIIAFLFFSSTIMAIAMGVAWLHFGRRRHVLSWTISYCVALVQWVANGLGVLFGNGALLALSALCVVISGTLVLVGVRQRSDLNIPWRLLIGTGGLVAAFAAYAALTGNRPMLGFSAPGYVAIMMAFSALSLWPRGRRFSAPEGTFFGILVLFTLFQAGLATSALVDMASPHREQLVIYRALLGLGLPSIYIGTGVAAILVVAGDLAHLLRYQMRHDPLTNVLNRRGLDEAAVRTMANARRHSRPLALVICDLDSFKALNDTYGHVTGDAALSAFAGLLAGAVRRDDVVARLGGDEFGLLLVETDAQSAAEVMERVRVEIGNMILPQASAVRLRASFGITELRPEDQSLEDVVLRADRALYDAKKSGRNRVAIWGAVPA